MKTEELERKIEENPGITFTELKKEFGLANGQLQYHLRKSKVFKKDKGYTTKKACQNCKYQGECGEKCKKNILRDEKKRKILKMLEKDIKKKEIANRIGISSSTLSYHINKLKKAKLISSE